MTEHRYKVGVRWIGNQGKGTATYASYARDHTIEAPGKAPIAGSSDPAYRGDARRWNPEELLVASLSACHQLWYLHLCSSANIVVLSYDDHAEGVLSMDADGGGRFREIVLRQQVCVADGTDLAKAEALHAEASRLCFIECSLACPVRHEAQVTWPAPR